MLKLEANEVNQLLTAMDTFKTIAEELIDKLVNETDQPEKDKIIAGHYYEIENADVLNGSETLSDNWSFDVHGEHCMFKNLTTGQTLEVSLGNRESVGNIDPYFFYEFLKTTKDFCHLTRYFENPFRDVLSFLEELEKQKIMICVYGVEFRKKT
ncbi:DUF6896 domain-containing protein [Flavobacterium sp. N2038]|uniref:DUF6896 domain-containing protein n=1 Tax=Flavobacterium sp. N2038 TaxID=2986829 RepID=UPI00222525D8|nr:hypothetical protein [Flavobacterium sp. N2038]